MADYVSRGKLKLKGVKDKKVKKKKKSEEKKLQEIAEAIFDSDIQSDSRLRKKTKAERAFEEVKEKRAFEEIMKKASKTHKEKIMDFNDKLAQLTEHYDIPKVSWTK